MGFEGVGFKAEYRNDQFECDQGVGGLWAVNFFSGGRRSDGMQGISEQTVPTRAFSDQALTSTYRETEVDSHNIESGSNTLFVFASFSGDRRPLFLQESYDRAVCNKFHE
jgi:hypothetical protein